MDAQGKNPRLTQSKDRRDSEGSLFVYRTPFAPVLFIALMVFIIEYCTNYFLYPLRYTSPLLLGFIDSILVVMVLSPVLYFFLYRPLFYHIEALKKGEQTLEEAELRNRAFFDNTSAGIVIGETISKSIRYVNPSLCQMLGYTPEELCGKSVTCLHPPEERDSMKADFISLEQGKKSSVSYVPAMKKDGTLIYVNLNAAPATIR